MLGWSLNGTILPGQADSQLKIATHLAISRLLSQPPTTPWRPISPYRSACDIDYIRSMFVFFQFLLVQVSYSNYIMKPSNARGDGLKSISLGDTMNEIRCFKYFSCVSMKKPFNYMDLKFTV